MASRGVVAAAMEAAQSDLSALESVWEQAAPYGGDYDREDRDPLNESFVGELRPRSAGFDLTLITTEPDAAYFSEHGSAPHMPPVDAITPWALFHDIDPWALAISIALKGTEAHPWQAQARADSLLVIDDIRRRIAARIVEYAAA